MKHEEWIAQQRTREDEHKLRSVPPSDGVTMTADPTERLMCDAADFE